MKWKKMVYSFLAVVCGAVTLICERSWILGAWISLGWRRPIQDWMTVHGAGSLAGYFGLLYIQIPEFALAILGGVTVGLVAWRRWWQLSLLYSGTMFGFPYILMTIDGSIWIILDNFGGGIFARTVLQNSLIVPLALGGAWGVSRGRCRRAARMASGHCVKCGYDLRGDVSGRCPECGEPKTTTASGCRTSQGVVN